MATIDLATQTHLSVMDLINLMSYPEKWVGIEGWERVSARFVWSHLWFFVLAGVLYIPAVLGLKAFMANRKAFVLRRPLLIWNILMATFSLAGFLSIYHPIIRAWISPGGISLLDTVCSPWCYKYGECARWVLLFNLSKVFEFVDTFFIVLRKRPLPFLHWYHHIVTYSFCMYANQTMHNFNCGGYIFCLMNFGVHAIMYSYYALRSAGYHPPIDSAITTLQILQMVGGTAVLIGATQCPTVDYFGTGFGLTIYVTFFYLFVQFFKRRYIDGKAHSE